MIAWFVVLGVLVGVILAVRLYMQRAAAQRAAHETRVRLMAQTALAAAKKKKLAETAAAEAALVAAPEAAPLAASPREERDCPFCAEPILKKARVCKHCNRDVEPIG